MKRGLKMKYGLLVAPAIIVLLSACATVQTQSAANTESETYTEAEKYDVMADGSVVDAEGNPVGADEDRIICKRTIASTTTRLGRKRMCMSVREWREMREATRSIMDEGQRRNLQVDVPGGG